MRRIVFFNVDSKEQAVLSKAFEGDSSCELFCYDKSLDMNTVFLTKKAEGVGVFIESEVTEKVIEQMPEVEVIVTLSTGFDHIDIEACKARKITVCNVPDYGVNTVAEYTFGLILALARKLKTTFGRVEHGDFSRENLMGMDLKGKTLGLIGTGRIGAYMVKLGRAFGMKVIAYDLYPATLLTSQFGVIYMSLEDVLSCADVISLHLPYSESTHYLIDAQRLKLLKPMALLINTSRGKVVDTRAVSQALRDGLPVVWL